MLVGLAQEQQVPTGLCLASVTTTAAVFEKVPAWLLEMFTQEALVMVFVFLKILYLESPNYLLRKPAEHLHQVLLVAAEAGDKVLVKDLCLAFSTEITIQSLFSVFFLIFLNRELVDLENFSSICMTIFFHVH